LLQRKLKAAAMTAMGHQPPRRLLVRGSYGSDNGREGGRLRRLTRDEAFLIAVNIAKLPSVPRQILKEIPRPPNSASPDD
jgi:hypothetical protein